MSETFDDLREAMWAGPIRWSVAVHELSGASPRGLGRIGDGRPVPLLELGVGEELPSASIGKILLLLAVSGRIEAGALHEKDVVDVLAEDKVADSGLLRHLLVRSLPVADLAALVGAMSDNLATNVLLRLVGLEAVRAMADDIGVRGVALHDKVRDARGPEHPPYLSTSSAAGLVELVIGLQRRRFLSPAACRRVVDWLRLDTDTSMVAGALGLDPLCHVDVDRGLTLWHKTGTNLGVRADCGVVEGPRGSIAYAALASWPAALDAGPLRDEALGLMGRLGLAIRTRLGSAA